MRPPRGNAFQVLRVEITRPPGDVGGMAGEIDHMLAGAAAGLDHVTGFAGEELQQYGADRLMVAMKRRRVETAVRFDRPPVLAEFHDIFRHETPRNCRLNLTRFKARPLFLTSPRKCGAREKKS